MANHCYNYAYFTGDPENIKRLDRALRTLRKKDHEEKYTSHGLEVPPWQIDGSVTLWAGNYRLVLEGKPDDFNKPNFDVYEVYGSKWFECGWEYEEGSDHIIISGDSAWSPVLKFFIKICKHYKLGVEGDYSESGMDFAGTFSIDEKGCVVHEEMSYDEYESEHNPDGFWENVIYEIEEGCYDTLEEIFTKLEKAKWKISDDERQQVTEVFNKYLSEQEKERDTDSNKVQESKIN